MKNSIKLPLIFLCCCLIVALFKSRENDNKPSQDFSTVESILSFLPGKSYTEDLERCPYGSSIQTISFYSDGTCIVTSLNKRTNLAEESYNGRYQVGFSRYTDTGGSFKYIRIDWEPAYSRRPLCYSFFGQSRIVKIKNFDGFDNYGPLVMQYFSEGGSVDNCYVYNYNR